MKIGSTKIIVALSALDPVVNSRVSVIHILLDGRNAFISDDVTVADGMVFARHHKNADAWLYVPQESVVGIEVMIDREACADANVKPTFAAVLESSLKH